MRSITELDDLSHNPSISNWDWEFETEVYIKMQSSWQENTVSSTTAYPVTLPQKQIALVSEFSRGINDNQ